MSILRRLFGPEAPNGPGHLRPRWLFLRALGLIFFSAFYSLLFQIRGLIGPNGILPSPEYLAYARTAAGAKVYWLVPTLFWLNSGDHFMMTVTWIGLVASLLLIFNFWPRGMIFVCLLCYVSFVATSQVFGEYQSDGMLMAAGFLSLFLAPSGFRPRLGHEHPPSWASRCSLLWLWFQIYFESGVVKLASHDPEWRHLTALDHYYENGPLPDWIGWYAQQLPHWFHAGTALFTLVAELGLVWMLFLPRRFKIICFLLVTPFQIGIILTANLAFINYLALSLGFLLLDDKFLGALHRRLIEPIKARFTAAAAEAPTPEAPKPPEVPATVQKMPAAGSRVLPPIIWREAWQRAGIVFAAIMLTWNFYAATAQLVLMFLPTLPLPTAPIVALAQIRHWNSGLSYFWVL